jgi:hypothetical protein
MLCNGSVLGPIYVIEMRPYSCIFGWSFDDVVINLTEPFIPEIDGDDTPTKVTSLFHVFIDVHGLMCSMEIAISYMYDSRLAFGFVIHSLSYLDKLKSVICKYE